MNGGQSSGAAAISTPFWDVLPESTAEFGIRLEGEEGSSER